MRHDQRLAAAFTELSDVHRPDFDADAYGHTLALQSVSLLDVDAAGWLWAGDNGCPEAAGGTTDAVRFLLVTQLGTGDGPAAESLRTQRMLSVADVAADTRWAAFRAAVLDAGFGSVHTLPLQQNGQVIGALSLFQERPGELAKDDLVVATALAEVAAACLLLKRSVTKAEKLAGQLQTALNSRVIIEQAKGILAERQGTSLDDAFELMRAFARHNRRRLNDVACAVVAGAPSVTGLIQASVDKPQTCLSGWLS